MLSEMYDAQHFISYLCNDIFEQYEETKKLKIARVPIRSSQHGWPLQKAAPYRRAFDKIIGILRAGK